jgi:hypothetical protein
MATSGTIIYVTIAGTNNVTALWDDGLFIRPLPLVTDLQWRASKLLRSFLTPRQKYDLTRWGFFEVVGSASGRTYYVGDWGDYNIFSRHQSGRWWQYCAGPIGLPQGDRLLGQMMCLQLRERHFVQVSNNRPFVAGATTCGHLADSPRALMRAYAASRRGERRLP